MYACVYVAITYLMLLAIAKISLFTFLDTNGSDTPTPSNGPSVDGTSTTSRPVMPSSSTSASGEDSSSSSGGVVAGVVVTIVVIIIAVIVIVIVVVWYQKRQKRNNKGAQGNII